MKKFWKLLMGISFVLGIALAVLSLVKGGCGGTIETAAGGSVPMKCHWAFRAVAGQALVVAVLSLVALCFKASSRRRALALSIILVDLLILAVLYFLIGVCGSSAMACVGNRTLVAILTVADIAVILVAAAVAGAGKEDKEDMPKQKV